MSASVAKPERALQLLQQLRARRRRLRNQNGLTRLLGWLAALLWLSFLLDWTLELPVAIRAFQLVAGIALGCAGIRILWFGPRRRMTLQQLAASVEDSVGTLEQSLITAIELTDPHNPRSQLYSPVLLARTVAEAEQRMANVPWDRIFSRRELRASLAVFLVLAVPMGLLVSARPDLASTYVSRNLLLADVQWPREYLLRLLEPTSESGETLLAMGDPLTVLVEKVRGGEARVFLRVLHEGGDRETLALERKGDDRYRRLFRNVTRDFSFVVEAGDFRSSSHQVTVRLRPRIERIELSYEYPEYTGLANTQVDTPNLGGHVKAPVGSRVRYLAQTSIPVRAATRVETRVSAREGDVEPLEQPIEVQDRRVLAGDFRVERDGYYSFKLESEDGFANSTPIRYRIAVVPDQPPEVNVIKPGRNLEVGVHAVLPIWVEARDDYGVVSGDLIVRTALQGDEAAELRVPLPELALAAAGAVPPGPGRRSVESSAAFELDLQKLSVLADSESRFPKKFEPGARIEYQVRVQDAIAQEGLSRTYLLNVVSVEDLVRIIQDDLNNARERLEETLDVQREARRDMERILDDTQLSGSPTVSKTELPNLRHSRLNQDKVGQRLDETDEKLQEIIGRVQSNRLNDMQDLPWIESRREDVARLSQEAAPQALRALDDLTRKASAGEAETSELRAAVDLMKANEKALRDLAQEFNQWGDLRKIVRRLEELLRTEKELEERVQEHVKGSLGN
ncbi:MAG: hypothetical protein AB7O52_00900 [Planctomycetota bacterium]